MRRAGAFGFVLLVAGTLGILVDHGGDYFPHVPWLILTASFLAAHVALLVFYQYVLRGKWSSMTRTAGVAAVLVGVAWLVSAGMNFPLATLSRGGAAWNYRFGFFLVEGHYYQLRLAVWSIFMLLLLAHIRRTGRIVINRRALILVVVPMLALGIEAVLLIQSSRAFGGTTGLLLLLVDLVGKLGFLVFWGSLVVAQRRHWKN